MPGRFCPAGTGKVTCSSFATFYRYFATKEDKVLSDAYDPMVEQVIARRPNGKPLVATIRAATDVVVGAANPRTQWSTCDRDGVACGLVELSTGSSERLAAPLHPE